MTNVTIKSRMKTWNPRWLLREAIVDPDERYSSHYQITMAGASFKGLERNCPPILAWSWENSNLFFTSLTVAGFWFPKGQYRRKRSWSHDLLLQSCRFCRIKKTYVNEWHIYHRKWKKKNIIFLEFFLNIFIIFSWHQPILFWLALWLKRF